MRRSALLVFLTLTLGTSFGSPAQAPLHLMTGESKLIHVEPGTKVAVGNPSVADVTVVSDQEILVSGRGPGNTDLIYINADGDKETQNILVASHNLKKSMVEMDVEIMEIENQSALKAGLSWGSIENSSSGGSTTGTATTTGSVNLNNLSISENNPPPLLAFGSFTRQSLTASLQLLINRGKAKVLAKPKLLAVSGEDASFLAGGEVPYITESKLGSSNVEWKPYGVKLRIRPSIDAEGNISASLRAEVSGLDIQHGVSTGGGVFVPAIRTRWAETSVYMKSGSTLVIAGLISEENQRSTSGLPILSDIPLIGELFKYTDNESQQTELVVFVTPSLVGQGKGME
ncbi:MAG TPA: pilus assembly protein N-terminal domain-containing protein [bacterium]|nr:pilus assembly protein N-terminal domain-containing protein [bacterium]